MHSEIERSRYVKSLDLGIAKRPFCICETERFRGSTLANVLP